MRIIKQFIILIIIIHPSINTTAQENKIDILNDQLKTAKKNNKYQEIFDAYIALGDAFSEIKEYNKAMKQFKRAHKESENNSDYEGNVISLNKIAVVYSSKREYESALEYLNNALEIARKHNLPTEYTTNMNIETVKNKIAIQKEAEAKYNQFKGLKEEEIIKILEEENKEYLEETSRFLEQIEDLSTEKQLVELKLKYKQDQLTLKRNQVDRKEIEIDLLNKENELKELALLKKNAESQKQKIIIWFGSIALLLLIAMLFFIYRSFRGKKKANELLTIKNQIITEKNKEITDSIKYAKRIQEAILISGERCNQILPQHFILFKPKDIVSGDFYWAYAVNETIAIWAVADCTGHGVPGAFMSMIGNRLLNEIIIEKRIISADQILNELKKNIISALGQEGRSGETSDGMDIAICVWNKQENTLEYSGANNSLYLVRKNIDKEHINFDKVKFFGSDLLELKADRQPIGYHSGEDVPFNKQIIQLKNNDLIYIFSDGYADQFGGNKSKKFTYKKFKELLTSLSAKTMDEQKLILDKTIEEWKGNEEQVDDICIIGIRV